MALGARSVWMLVLMGCLQIMAEGFSALGVPVFANLMDCRDFTLMKGWIPTRFQEVADRHFAFVHIDVDLYEPTRDSLA